MAGIPKLSDCDLAIWEFEQSANVVVFVRVLIWRGLFIDYSLSLVAKDPQGRRREMFRLDCSHSEVHVHDFTEKRERRRKLFDIYSAEQVDEAYLACYQLIYNWATRHQSDWEGHDGSTRS